MPEKMSLLQAIAGIWLVAALAYLSSMLTCWAWRRLRRKSDRGS